MADYLPRIGITTSLQDGEQRLGRDYVAAVERAEGLSIILPMVQNRSTAAHIADDIDGLVITGGPAVILGITGEVPADLDPANDDRLASDRMYIELFREKKAPILGICYGMQLLNALNGGTIYADIQREIPGALPHSVVRGAGDHPVMLEAGSRLRRILGVEEVRVNSRHIQAVATLASGYRVAARAADGVIEAIESVDGREIGVQFHPERLDEMVPLFRYFVDVARSTHSFGHSGTSGDVITSVGNQEERSR